MSMVIKKSQLKAFQYSDDSASLENNLATPPEYVCEVTDKQGRSRVGLITLLNYRYYPDKIAPHENFNPELSNLYESQFCDFGELVNPIILFYRGIDRLCSFIENINENEPLYTDTKNESVYKVWKLSHEIKHSLCEHMNSISAFYVADGHHRIQALRALNEKLRQDPSSFYMSFLLHESQIDMQNNDRYYYVTPEALDELCNKLSLLIKLREEDHSCSKMSQSHISCLIHGKWHRGFVENKSVNLLTLSTFVEDIVLDLKKQGKIIKDETACLKDIPAKEKYYKQHNFNFMIVYPRITANEIEDCKKFALVFPKNSTCISPKLPNRLFVYDLNDRKIKVSI